MRAMSALALRHEDSINTLQADLSFIVYLDTPGKTAASAIPALVQTQREHKQTSEGIPLRQKLLIALFSQLESQIQKVVADKDLIQAGIHDGLLKQEGSSEVLFVYQTWDATAAKQVLNDSVKPISTREILLILREIASLAGTPGSISRFQISRSISHRGHGRWPGPCPNSAWAIRDHRSPRPPPKSCGKYRMAPHRGQLSERRHQAVALGIANREALQEGGLLLSLTPNCGMNTGKTGPVGKASFGSRCQELSMVLFLESLIHLGGGFLPLPK